MGNSDGPRTPTDEIADLANRFSAQGVKACPCCEDKLDKKACWFCQKVGDCNSLRKCLGCKVARYCDEQCANKDWDRHFDFCTKKKKEAKVEKIKRGIEASKKSKK